MSQLIRLQNIGFHYPGSSDNVINITSMEIQKGERVFLFGPSGSGKTTLLEMLAGVLVPQQGQVQILDTDITKLNPAQRDDFRGANIGYIFQSFNLIPYLNVQENILLPLYLSRARMARLQGADAQQEAQQLCEHLGIVDFLNRSVSQLSVGQQQRVAVARALLGHPALILADEPTSSLDYDHRERFIQLLFDVCEKNHTTVLFVSHDRSLEKLFSRAISFNDINQKVAK